jgi:hypothetical protein
VATARRRKLDRAEVQKLIDELLAQENIDKSILFAFAETINGAQSKEPKVPKKKAIMMTQLRKAVLNTFGGKTAADLKKNKTISMSIFGEDYALKIKSDWMKLYRCWVAVPESERGLTGATCINGIDVLENFRPWHVFGLDSSTATPEDVKSAFREPAKTHHPDVGGDARVFERLQKMRDSVVELMS